MKEKQNKTQEKKLWNEKNIRIKKKKDFEISFKILMQIQNAILFNCLKKIVAK